MHNFESLFVWSPLLWVLRDTVSHRFRVNECLIDVVIYDGLSIVASFSTYIKK